MHRCKEEEEEGKNQLADIMCCNFLQVGAPFSFRIAQWINFDNLQNVLINDNASNCLATNVQTQTKSIELNHTENEISKKIVWFGDDIALLLRQHTHAQIYMFVD